MSLLDEVRGQAAARKRAAVGEYFALLQRAASPQAGDAEQLVELMQQLNRTDDDVAADLAVVDRIKLAAELQGKVPQLEAARQSTKARRAEVTAAHAEAKAAFDAEWQARLSVTESDHNRAVQAVTAANTQLTELGNPRRDWMERLGVEAPATE